MASKNDGLGMGPEFWAPLPGQDRRHFPLGSSDAVPAPGYFADAFGLANEQVIMDAIAGLTDPQQIEDALTAQLRGERHQAQDFMRWRLKMRKNAKRT
ncbi:MAG: hypothetical protein EKK33_06720 [Bradyrhizobiaceae bacterium]|nr:MAG: hypothetical protein EKK33_06720 [Bradyrhizobiaceae bacterium]